MHGLYDGFSAIVLQGKSMRLAAMMSGEPSRSPGSEAMPRQGRGPMRAKLRSMSLVAKGDAPIKPRVERA